MLTIPRLSGAVGVYALMHLASGTCYVGASRSLLVRFFAHEALLVKGTHYNQALQADWNMYGPDAFVFKILDYIDGTRDRLVAERQWKRALPRLYNPPQTAHRPWANPQRLARSAGEGRQAELGTFTHMDVRHTRHSAYQIVYASLCPRT